MALQDPVESELNSLRIPDYIPTVTKGRPDLEFLFSSDKFEKLDVPSNCNSPVSITRAFRSPTGFSSVGNLEYVL